MTTNTTTIENISTTDLHHARLAKAKKLASMLDAEYPMLRLDPQRNDIGKVTGWKAYHAAEIEVESGDEPDVTEELTLVYEGDKVPEIADLMNECEDQGLLLETDDEEEKASGSVVAVQYRTKYRENSSSGQSCGDWLAETLTMWCTTSEGTLDVDAFQAILDRNPVDQSGKWAKLKESGQPGWAGRWRMNGRQALEKAIAWAGEIVDANGATHEIPADALADLRSKHAKWIAKQQKIEAALMADDDAA